MTVQQLRPYTCEDCGKPCAAKWEDMGFGATEMAGIWAIDENWQFISDCCEALTLEEPPHDM